MKNERYNMSFTTGGLFLRESVEIAELYLQNPDWESVRERALGENIFQFRKITSARRSLNEALKRLKNLSRKELEYLVNTNTKEQKQLLWVAVCKTYRFVHDFALEIIRDKYMRLEMEISNQDFQIFFNHKAELDPHLEELTERSRRNCRTTLFKIMYDADILTKDKLIIPAMFSNQFVNLIKEVDIELLLLFPITEGDIQRLLSNG